MQSPARRLNRCVVGQPSSSTHSAAAGIGTHLRTRCAGNSTWTTGGMKHSSGGESIEVTDVAQLDEVLAGIRMLDAGIGEMLQPQHHLVLLRLAEGIARSHVASEAERAAKQRACVPA